MHIQEIKEPFPDHDNYDAVYADCFIVTANNKILLQKRPETWPSFPNAVTPFGGLVENETVTKALTRELKEELDVCVSQPDIHYLMAVEEIFENKKFLIYLHWWHDKQNSVQTCHEGERIYCDTIDDAIAIEIIMPHALIGLLKLRTLIPPQG